jgi:hypothetical protein
MAAASFMDKAAKILQQPGSSKQKEELIYLLFQTDSCIFSCALYSSD